MQEYINQANGKHAFGLCRSSSVFHRTMAVQSACYTVMPQQNIQTQCFLEE